MKKLSVLFIIMILTVGIFTGCSDKSFGDSLAKADRETESGWGLDFSGSKADKDESDNDKDNLNQESDKDNGESANSSIVEAAEGIKMYTTDDIIVKTKSEVNVRKGPGTTFEKIGKLQGDEELKVSGVCENRWVLLNSDDITGYVSLDYIEPLDDSVSFESIISKINDNEENSEESSSSDLSEDEDTAWSTIDLNMRKGPGTTFEKIGVIKKDDSIKVIDKSDSVWWEIEYNGQTGYVSSKYITSEKPE